MRSPKFKEVADIKRGIDKASSGKYKFVLLPCNAIYDFHFQTWVDEIQSGGLVPLIQVNTKSLNQLTLNSIQELAKKGCHFNFLVHPESARLKQNLEQLETMNLNRFYSVVFNKSVDMNKVMETLPPSIKDLSLYLPFKKKRFDGNYSCYQLDRKIKNLSKKWPGFSFKPIQGLDQFDPRISPDLELEPMTKPELINTISSDQEIKISIIIPTYNNQNYIQNNIRHLSLQSLPPEQFELILVNDGSSDNTGDRIKEILGSLSNINYKYIFLPRPKKRFMGDAQFRAGIARNLGVKWARGKYVSFLDADMISPKDYLVNLLNDLKQHDVIQTERHYLKSKVSSNSTNYEDLNAETDTFVPEQGYWHNFYKTVGDWNEMKAGWKYVCTYSLTLSRQLFLDIGWFRKTYMFYGFEDTDLGYRLFRADKKFRLSKMKIFHLCQNDERSEYSNSDYLRQVLLSKTAKIFYRNYLDEHIYKELKSLINDGPGLEDIIPRIFIKK